MVNPANKLKFRVGTKGRESAEMDMKTILDVESFEMTFDNGVEEWNPYDMEGWRRALMTAKSMTISISGKRNVGDPGNDYIASLIMVNGEDANTIMEVEFPDGDKIKMPCVANVSNIGGGDATAVNGLEAEFMSDGKPSYIEVTA